jgi:hypothetical protein
MLFALHLVGTIAAPTTRDYRSLGSLVLFILGTPALYLLCVLARHIWWERLRSRWFVALAVLLAPIAAALLAGLTDDWANARELTEVQAQLQPLVAALEQERARLGRPTLELQLLLMRHRPMLRRLRRGRFLYLPGSHDFALAAGVTPRHRDNTSYAFRSTDGRWTWFDLPRQGDRGLPSVAGAPVCHCRFYREWQWVCEPPCGPGLAALSHEPESPAVSPPSAASPAPTPDGGPP